MLKSWRQCRDSHCVCVLISLLECCSVTTVKVSLHHHFGIALKFDVGVVSASDDLCVERPPSEIMASSKIWNECSGETWWFVFWPIWFAEYSKWRPRFQIFGESMYGPRSVSVWLMQEKASTCGQRIDTAQEMLKLSVSPNWGLFFTSAQTGTKAEKITQVYWSINEETNDKQRQQTSKWLRR